MVASTEPSSPKVPLLAKFGKPRALQINSVSSSSANITAGCCFHKTFTNVVISSYLQDKYTIMYMYLENFNLGTVTFHQYVQ